MPPSQSTPLAVGATRQQVDAYLGTPTKMAGTTALYSYKSAANEQKIMAAYFDASGRLQRFARYISKDGKVVDELTQNVLTEAAELPTILALLGLHDAK